jgi:excisionase family DNA binding protein
MSLTGGIPSDRHLLSTLAPERARTPRNDDLLVPIDAAEIATRSVRTIRRAYSSGRLTAYRDRSGRGVRIRYGDLRNWMMAEEISSTGSKADELTTPLSAGACPPGSFEQSLSLLRAARGSRRRSGGSRPTVS